MTRNLRAWSNNYLQRARRAQRETNTNFQLRCTFRVWPPTNPPFAATVAGVARKTGADSCALTLTITEVPADPQQVYSAMQGLAEGVIHGSYQFTKYKSKSDSSHKLKEAKIAFSADDVRGMNGAMLRDALAKGRIIAESGKHYTRLGQCRTRQSSISRETR